MQYCPDKNKSVLQLDCMKCKRKSCESFFLLVIGARTFDKCNLLEEKLDFFLQNQTDVIIVSGAEFGVDKLVTDYSKDRGFEHRIFRAEWAKYGHKADYIRNRKMHDYISKQEKRGVILFWDGKSNETARNIELAKEFGNPIRIVRY
jgi:hypothetical protein